MREIEMENMTWTEIQEAMKEGVDTVLVPFGSTEQHGPHCPLGTDSFNCFLTAKRTALELGNALVAPYVAYGWAIMSIDFTGTMSLRHETFFLVAQDLIMSLIRHGFKKIVLFNGHVPNGPVLLDVARTVRNDYRDVYISVCNPWITLMEDYHEMIGVPKGSVIWREFVGHAAIYEASCVMARDPDLVKLHKAEFTPIQKVLAAENQALMFPAATSEHSKVGAYGNPFVGCGPSRELGEKFVEESAKRCARAIKHQIEVMAEHG